jgi:hypothetical protein
MVYPPLMPAISPACLEAFVLAAGICLTAAFVLTKSKTASERPAKMLLRKKRKKQMHGRRRHGKRWLPNHAGI